jgi:hypothetical protein
MCKQDFHSFHRVDKGRDGCVISGGAARCLSRGPEQIAGEISVNQSNSSRGC